MREGAVVVAFDVISAGAAVAAASWVWGAVLGRETTPWQVLLACAVGLLWVALLGSSRGLRRGMRRSVLEELPEVCRQVLVGGMVVALAASPTEALTEIGQTPVALDGVGFVVSMAGIGLLLVPVGRAGAYRALDRFGRRARGRAIVVGADEAGRRIAKVVGGNPQLRTEVVGFVDDVGLAPAAGEVPPVLGGTEDLGELLADGVADHVLVAAGRARPEQALRIVKECDRHGANVSIIPEFHGTATVRSRIEDVGGISLLHLNRVRLTGTNAAFKRAFDLVVAASGLIAISPLLLALAAVVRLTSPGPVLFYQERVGPEGRVFRMYKFRSMRRDAESEGTWTRRGDPRRTWIGKIMRPLNLDELPQLLNVVKGDLSLVGPRPEQPRYVTMFESSIYRYGDRHRIRGGITGWAQVNGLRGDTSIEERVLFDNYYIENWSLWLDIRILILTLGKAGLSAAEKASGGGAGSPRTEENGSNGKAVV